jgi:hypothetical protein
MQQALRTLIFTFILSLIAACNLGRGFKPPPNANEGWTSKQNPSQVEVNKAMITCGTTELSDGTGQDNSPTARVTRQECMFKKGFFYKSGWGGLCTIPEVRSSNTACATAPLRSRDSYYGN